MSIRNTLGRLFGAIWAGVDGIRKVLHLFVLLFLFALILGALSSTSTPVPSQAALVITPVGALVEQLEGDPYDRAIAELLDDAEPQTLVRDVIEGLRFAKDDSRIEVVVLELGGMGGGGLSKLEAVADAIDEFRESGKPVIASANFYGQGAYYLAAHADEIYMHPDGMFLPQGFGMYTNYYKEAIDKLRIDWNVFRVGTHKSAVEPYLRMDMSPEDREDRTRVVDQLWQKFEADIVAARGLGDGALTEFADNLLTHIDDNDGSVAVAAESLGFVDELLTKRNLQDRVSVYAQADEDSDRGYKSSQLGDYLAQMRLLEGSLANSENVAIVIASGEILNGSQPPGTIGGESTAKLLRRARMDESVKAVVLRVDSPGGSAFASEQIRNEIEALKDEGKPVVASMSSLAASGGYWISMAADQIFARETTITGSIGVFGMFPTFQRALDAIGIGTDGVGTTPWAGQFRGDREMSDDARQFIQALIEKDYDEFISKVAKHRDIEKDEVDSIAQGKVWTGTDALELGLIDAIGDLDAAVAVAAELAELDADSFGRKYFQKELGATEQMIVDMLSSAARVGIDLKSLRVPNPGVERLLELVDDSASSLLRFNDPKGVYSHCFCSVN